MRTVPIILSGGCPDFRLAATILPSSAKIRMAATSGSWETSSRSFCRRCSSGGAEGESARTPASIARMMTRPSRTRASSILPVSRLMFR